MHGRRDRLLRMMMQEFAPRLPDDRDRCSGDTMGVAVDLGKERVWKFDGFAHVDARLAVDVAGGWRELCRWNRNEP